MQAVSRSYATRRRRLLLGKGCTPCALNTGNLGELERLTTRYPGEDYTPPVGSFTPEVRFDGPAITVSIVLLVILLVISLDRILGLTELLTRALVQNKRDKGMSQARRSLESIFSESDDDVNSGGDDDSTPPWRR